VDCIDIADRLLAAEAANDPELDRHVADCPRCSQLARGLQRLDVVLSSVVLAEPPIELQHSLAQLVREAARPQTQPWWQRLPDIGRWLTERPQLAAAQGLAAIMLALASWQLFGWVSAFQPVVGNVGYALELVAASPAVAYVGNAQIDLQSLSLWSVVGIVGWLISENGVIGRRIASRGLRWP
jgi:hypothetical protein